MIKSFSSSDHEEIKSNYELYLNYLESGKLLIRGDNYLVSSQGLNILQ